MGGFLWYNSTALAALTILGTWAPMMGNIGLLAVMGGVSLAIMTFFIRSGEATSGMNALKVIVCPIIAAGGLFYATYLLVDNRKTLAFASGVPFVDWMWLPPVLMFVVGCLMAVIYRSTDPARYAGIGRYLHEDMPTGGD
jgi:hypothetical protein